MWHRCGMGGGKKHLMGTELYVLFVGQISVRLSTTQNTSTTAQTAEQRWTEVLKMAEYIDKEIALSLVQPDTPEDEKNAITIATAKKLVRSIVYRTPTADVAPVVHGRWIDAYPDIEPNPMFMYGICSECEFEQGISKYLNYCPNCGAKMDEGDGNTTMA